MSFDQIMAQIIGCLIGSCIVIVVIKIHKYIKRKFKNAKL